ncbi:oxidoreductase [Actinoallomurus rhizosphaericola]|uniref:oxidoreductase n=1 Tax=Actinoallomurus rhizosphaericola TaxID=2952536 RepID=UPI00209024CB|nr:oxidoreductase [Actinoallomurus rhizosphaericola]MCO5993378.1 oxidoreductase [Actinoallomurus rhizosphaericola]
MAKWTTDDIPDLTGTRVIVTGANSGIGLRTVLELARHGATVVLACRSAERGRAALDRVRAAVPDCDIALGSLDLADLGSVRAFAEEQGEHGLDLLINNAGVMAPPHRTTADGFELQFGTNHLGHFALTGLLLPALLDRPGARVVTVTSMMHRLGRLDFDDLDGERRYRKWAAYCRSKLANLVFAKELDRRAGGRLVSVAAHPGYAATNLQQAGPRMAGSRIGELVQGLGTAILAQSDAAGAQPTLYAATAAGVRGGQCYGPRGPGQSRGAPRRVPTLRAADDPGLGRRLWEISEERTGVTYDALGARTD